MINQISKIWVVDRSGLVIFHPSDSIIDHQRLGALSSIVQIHSKYNLNESFRHVRYRGCHLQISIREKFTIIALYKKSRCIENIKRYLSTLCDKVEEVYPQEFQGDLQFISDLKKELTPSTELLGDYLESKWRN